MSIIKAPLQGEILAPGEGITLTLAMHPLKPDRIIRTAPAGLTVAELVEIGKSFSDTGMRYRAVVYLGGHFIPEDLWDRVRPKPGTNVVVRAVAEGGDLMKAILGIAIIAVGIWLGPILGPIIGISAALATAGITIAGQLILNALFPVAQPQLAAGSTSSTYSLSGGRNVADPFGTIAVNLGRNRVYPKLAAKSYTEFSGSDQYLRELMVPCYGPVDISDVKIGETLLTDFDDVTVEIRQGYNTDLPVTLYPGEVLQADLSIDLTAAAGWQTRTTDLAIDEISLDFVAPQGIVLIDSTGASQNYTVNIRAEYSPTGAGTWVLLGLLNLTANSTDAIRKALRLTVTNGQYDVRVKKTGTDYSGTDHVQEQVLWTAIRGFRNTPPIVFPFPLAVIAVRIRATSQLNGAIDELNCIAQSRVTSWNGAAWVPNTLSRNPADLFRYVLQCTAIARPQADGRIDLTTIQAWADYCTAQGFTFDLVLDTVASVYDTLTLIATAGRAAVLHRDGLWSVVWDDPSAPIVQHFTPRNSWGFSGSRTYPRMPHAFRIRFVNEATGYAQDERIVYDDGYNSSNATLFESIEMPGQVNAQNVWRHGRFHIAQARLRPEFYSLTVDIEHIVCTRGDRVRVTHDVPLWGLGSGRVVAVVGQVITLDEPVTMEAAQTYTIRFRLADGSSLLQRVVTNDGVQTTVTVIDAGLPAVDDLFMFGENNQESVVLRIRSITPTDAYSAKITLVDDAPAISSADTGAIPAFDSHVTLPIDTFDAAPINLIFLEVFQGVDGAAVYGATISWETLVTQYPVTFDVEYSSDVDGIWKSAGSTVAPIKTIFIPGLTAGSWSFRVRSVFASGHPSKWATLGSQAILGVGAVPMPDVTNFRTTYVDNTSALTWDEVRDFRDVRYELRKGTSWASALVISSEQAHPPFATYGDGTYWISAVSRPLPGLVVYSANPVSIVIAGSLLVDNVIATHDEAGTGWTGTVTGPGIITSGLFKTTAPDTITYYEIPNGHIFDMGYSRPTRLGATWKATGEPVSSDVLTDPDFLNNPDILGAAAARQVDSWVEYAAADTGSTDVFADPDVFAPADVFAILPTFGPWIKFAPGVVVERFVKFRLALRSNDPTVNGAATDFTVSADVPDRVDHLTNHALLSGGETFTFTPDGSATPTPFIGGPVSAVVPAIQVTILNAQAGDIVFIDPANLSLAHASIQIMNGGVGVARNINAFFQGW